MVSVSLDASYSELTDYAEGKSLVELVRDIHFVQSVNAKDFADDSVEDLFLCSMLVDLFHDHFNMNSARRKQVSNAITEGTHTLQELFTMNVSLAEGPGLQPQNSQHTAEGLSGPYPLKSTGPPSAFSLPSDTTEVVEGAPGLSSLPAAQQGGPATEGEQEGLVSLTAGLAEGAPLYQEQGSAFDPATSIGRLTALQEAIEKQHGSLEQRVHADEPREPRLPSASHPLRSSATNRSTASDIDDPILKLNKRMQACEEAQVSVGTTLMEQMEELGRQLNVLSKSRASTFEKKRR